MLKAAIVGNGAIARVHLRAFERLTQKGVPIEVVAICDINIAHKNSQESNLTFTSEMDTERKYYENMEEMLRNQELDYVLISTPTYLHAEMTKLALKYGVNVLCEKPMALSVAEAEEMAEAAVSAKKHLLIGQCLRFWHAYGFLKQCIEDNRYGRVVNADFYRLTIVPSREWKNWFLDNKLSGGCLLDFHIHDADIIRFLFGEPEMVSTLGNTVYTVGGYDAVNTRFKYAGKLVTATADWTLNDKHGFHQGYRINFEKANVLFADDFVVVNPTDGDKHLEDIGSESPYYYENKFFIDLINGETTNNLCTPEDSIKTIRLLERMKESADHNGKWL